MNTRLSNNLPFPKPALIAVALAVVGFAAHGVRSVSAPIKAAPTSVPVSAIQIHQSLARRVVTIDAQGRSRETWQPLADNTPVQPGDVLRDTQQVENRSSQPIKNFVLTQPVVNGLEYVPASADVTGADGVQITFHVDGAAGFSASPTVAVPLPDGTTKRIAAPPSTYRAVRWTFMQPIPAGTSAQAVCVETVR